MKRYLSFILIALALTVSIFLFRPDNSTDTKGEIVIASKDFTEQYILSELLAQQIENHTGLKVERRFHLGGSFICHQAIAEGKIDAYVEYTGTAYAGILEQKSISDPQEVFRILSREYANRFDLRVMPSLGFENTFAIIVRDRDADRYKIETLSQAAAYTPQWRGGFGYEFLERADGFKGLAETYNLRFAKPPQIMDLGLIYRALLQGQVDLIVGNSTDGQIARLNLKVLEDDKRYFPPYEATPIVRNAILKKYPVLEEAISKLAGSISAGEMRQMNYLVEGELRDVEDVVREFLRSKGLSHTAANIHKL